MKLAPAVLSAMRTGALGGAVALAAACSKDAAPIHREPAARLAPVVATAPPTPEARVVAAPATLVPAALPVAADAGTVVVADAADAGARRHRRRRELADVIGNTPGLGDPGVLGLGTAGRIGVGRQSPGGAGCGRG